MSWDEIVEFWGKKNLRRWPVTVLAAVAIPEPSRRFLAEVGLPTSDDWALVFDSEADHDLPRLPRRASLRRIGSAGGEPICLDEDRGGAVVRVSAGRPEFINTTVEQLGEVLTMYEDYRVEVVDMEGAPEERILQFISTVEQRMRAADLPAFADVNGFWPVIIEQMKDGML